MESFHLFSIVVIFIRLQSVNNVQVAFYSSHAILNHKYYLQIFYALNAHQLPGYKKIYIYIFALVFRK